MFLRLDFLKSDSLKKSYKITMLNLSLVFILITFCIILIEIKCFLYGIANNAKPAAD